MRRRSRLGLSLALLLLTAAPAAAELRLVGARLWFGGAQAGFGGFSAIHVKPDGKGFVALTDRGSYVTGTLLRNAAGQISGVEASLPRLLRGVGQEPLTPGRRDSEGLAIAPDGTAYVSFEGVARVLEYRRLDGPARNLPSHADFADLPANRQLEALAVDAQGVLYTIPEGLPGAAEPVPVYRYRKGRWDKPFHITPGGDFLPVAADIGPDGRLYLLERAFAIPGGFRSRIRSFDPGATGTEAGRVLLVTPSMRHGNLEGMSVWRDQDGALRFTMIGDNNFAAFLPTEIVEYRQEE